MLNSFCRHSGFFSGLFYPFYRSLFHFGIVSAGCIPFTVLSIRIISSRIIIFRVDATIQKHVRHVANLLSFFNIPCSWKTVLGRVVRAPFVITTTVTNQFENWTHNHKWIFLHCSMPLTQFDSFGQVSLSFRFRGSHAHSSYRSKWYLQCSVCV